MKRNPYAFEEKLYLKCKESLRNNFGKDNYEETRYGKYQESNVTLPGRFKSLVKTTINFFSLYKNSVYKRILGDYGRQFEAIYSELDEPGKALLIKILAFRILGFKHVKIFDDNDFYFRSLEIVEKIKDKNESIDPHFLNFILNKFDLNAIGYDIKIFLPAVGVVIDFVLEQYAYRSNNKSVVVAERGDVVLDIGACWGDTALYFASKVGNDGKVFSFEFIPDNIDIFKKNTSLNPHLEKQIQLVSNPVSEVGDQTIYFKDGGPGSVIKMHPFSGQTGQTSTVSIDDFVVNNNLEKISYIKMDIEGAEPLALRGAINTIRRFKPKLAIAIYHSLDDFANIPNWILSLDLGYQIYLGHYTIHGEETVIFAKAS